MYDKLRRYQEVGIFLSEVCGHLTTDSINGCNNIASILDSEETRHGATLAYKWGLHIGTYDT